MSNSTTSFKEAFMNVYLPGILVFFSFVACGTCLSAGPFFPVGISGIVALVTLIWLAVRIIKNNKYTKVLEATVQSDESAIESMDKAHKNELKGKDSLIDDLNHNVKTLEARIAILDAELKKKAEKDLLKEDTAQEKLESSKTVETETKQKAVKKTSKSK